MNSIDIDSTSSTTALHVVLTPELELELASFLHLLYLLYLLRLPHLLYMYMYILITMLYSAHWPRYQSMTSYHQGHSISLQSTYTLADAGETSRTLISPITSY